MATSMVAGTSFAHLSCHCRYGGGKVVGKKVYLERRVGGRSAWDGDGSFALDELPPL